VPARRVQLARGSRDAALERRGLQGALPAWMHLRPAQNAQRVDTDTLRTISSFPRSTKARQVQRKYALRDDVAQAPWATAIHNTYKGLIGDDELGRFALTLLATSKESGTYRNYDNNFNKFVDFCTSEGLPPLEATPAHIVRYVAWLGKQGTNAAHALQPLFSAINHVYEAHGLPRIATGTLVNEAVKGLAGWQVPITTPTRRVALPAQAAYKVFQSAESLVQTLSDPTYDDSGFATTASLRDCLATIVSYVWFNRSDTTHSLRQHGFTVDGPSTADPQMRLWSAARKGRKRAPVHTVPTISIPVSSHPRLAALLRFYFSRRQAIFDKLGRQVPTYVWALPQDKPHLWNSTVQNVWMAAALRCAGVTQPEGFTYTSHSLRSGAASAASAIGVPLPQIKFYGGWARNSSVVNDYIDPTFTPSEEARFFFGWLAPRRLG